MFQRDTSHLPFVRVRAYKLKNACAFNSTKVKYNLWGGGSLHICDLETMDISLIKKRLRGKLW